MVTMPPEATRRIGSTVTGSGALTAGQHTPVDATAGTLTLTLPIAPRYGASLSVEKTDSTTNAVVVSGSIRGSAGTLSLGYQYETIEFRADGGGTWRPIVNHLPKSAVDTKVAALATSVAATYQPLLPTAGVKTAAYTTPGNEIVPVDATSGAVPITLPAAPADKTRVTVKKTDATTNTVSISRGGTTDVFNKVGGSTTLTLSLQNQSTTIQYLAASGLWYVIGGDLPLSQLDARYPAIAALTAKVDTAAQGASIGTATLNSAGLLTVAVSTPWGIRADGTPYYNAAGVTAGDQAIFELNPTTGAPRLIKIAS